MIGQIMDAQKDLQPAVHKPADCTSVSKRDGNSRTACIRALMESTKGADAAN
jgi:hypothetical protein